jgi:hypothetical protein
MDVDVVEDYDRSVMYIKHYGKSIRYFDVYLKTRYWAKGGLAQKRTKDYYLENVNKLLAKYPHHLSSNQKLIRHLDKIHPLPNVVFSLLKNRKTKIIKTEALPENDTEIIVGDAIDKTIFDPLYAMLNNIKFDRKIDRCNRRNFPPHYAVTFGIVRDRYKGKVGNSAVTERNPKVFEELKRIASIIRPEFTFTSIHINKNLTCPRHKDEKNVGKSMIISIGDYEGSKLMIEGCIYDTLYIPILFNGADLEHWNSDDLTGSNKYSIVYYNVEGK